MKKHIRINAFTNSMKTSPLFPTISIHRFQHFFKCRQWKIEKIKFKIFINVFVNYAQRIAAKNLLRQKSQ